MLQKIILLRHAKSSWEDPSLRDFDRPLSKRDERYQINEITYG